MATSDGVFSDDPGDLAGFIHRQEIWMIELPAPPGMEGTAALTAEIDDFPALVAFTSEEELAKHARAYPELLEDGGQLATFMIPGADFLAQLPQGFGVLLNPETEEKCIILSPELAEQVKRVRIAEADLREGPADPGIASGGQVDAQSIRAQSLAALERLSFSVAPGLPYRDADQVLRPAGEIAGRLMALATLFTWASAPEDLFPSEHIQGYARRNHLHDWLTSKEWDILSLPRQEAVAAHSQSVGWKLENMWPLAWTLGFDPEPLVGGAQIDMAIARAIITEFLGNLSGTADELVRKRTPRPRHEMVMMEDLFYCAHNAVRSAQQGGRTVPDGFDPVSNGGVIHERRHALTWALSPGVPWSNTDLST